jgi:hypothetical protein
VDDCRLLRSDLLVHVAILQPEIGGCEGGEKIFTSGGCNPFQTVYYGFHGQRSAASRSDKRRNEMTRKINDEYFADMAYLPGSDIAGMAMFDALIDVLRAAERSNDLPDRKQLTVLRQIAKQAEKIAVRYNLDHNIDFDVYFTEVAA